MMNLSCPTCNSEEITKKGWEKYSNGRKQQRFFCKNCQKTFLLKPNLRKAEPANVTCPKCQSSNTIKRRKTKFQRLHGEVQACFCRDCESHFTQGKKKMFDLYIQEKLVGRFPVTIHNNHYPNLACPKCGEHKLYLYFDYINMSSKAKQFVCFGCGHKPNFTEQGGCWNASVMRRMGKKIEIKSFKYEDNRWDLRVLYPDIDEHDFCQVFLYFNDYEFRELKAILKDYIIYGIQQGFKSKTVIQKSIILNNFFQFLSKNKIKSFSEISRSLIARYWIENRSHVSQNTICYEMSALRLFFQWLIKEKNIDISPTLITNLDYPKIYKNDPDPLEDDVLESIRNNIHVLPEPLQLQFMLGFWLGTRLGELSKLSKNCISLDPDGSIWWLKFERDKKNDENRLPITTDLVRLIQKQQEYINNLFGLDYPYLFCHYRKFQEKDYPNYVNLEAVKRFPMPTSINNPMVKVIRHLIKFCQIKDGNGEEVNFIGKILRPTRATHLIQNGYSLEFVRIWLKHKSANTTYKHYIRYRPGELLDVATVMANLDNKFYPYDSNPSALQEQFQDLRQNPKLQELDGLTTIGGVPLIGYCLYRDFCPRFGHCYGCGFHVASSDKLSLYKEQLDKLKAKKTEVFNFGSAEMLGGYEDTIRRLEAIIEALESQDE